MDVQQGGGDAGAGSGPARTGDEPASGSRLGLIVGVALAVLAGLAVTLVLLTRDSGDAATPVPRASAAPSVSEPPSGSPSAGSTTGAAPAESPDPGDYADLRADGIDPLDLRMSKEQALATGAVVERDVSGTPQLRPDPDRYPGLVVSYDPNADLIQAFTVMDGSPITTPDGIGASSTVDDLREAYGVLLQERAEGGDVWYVVPVDDVGYAFFPTVEEMVMVAATDLVLDDLRPGKGL